MKVYTVVDNSQEVLKTTDKLKAFEELYRLYKKYDDKQTWFRIDEDELQ